MFSFGSNSDNFRIDYGFNYAINFCIWILEIDGLQVAPFNHHPKGNGSLSKKGMDEFSWKNWRKRLL